MECVKVEKKKNELKKKLPPHSSNKCFKGKPGYLSSAGQHDSNQNNSTAVKPTLDTTADAALLPKNKKHN